MDYKEIEFNNDSCPNWETEEYKCSNYKYNYKQNKFRCYLNIHLTYHLI